MTNYRFNKIIEKTRKTVLAGFGLLLVTFSLLAHAGKPATEYELELFDAPGPTHPSFPMLPWTRFTDISDKGIVVWQSATLDPSFHEIDTAGLYDVKNDEYVTLWKLNWTTGAETGDYAYGINKHGALVTEGGCSYFDKKGNHVQLTHPLYNECHTRGINGKGIISGYTRDGGIWRGFIYNPKDESFEDFLPDPDRNIAQGINSKGQVVGGIGNPRDGYVRDRDGDVRRFKVYIDGVSHSTQARGITDKGIIVGTFSKDGKSNGFVGRLSKDPADEDLIPDMVFSPDNTPECDAGIFLTRINKKGVISGICWADGKNIERGLLLTPVRRGKK